MKKIILAGLLLTTANYLIAQTPEDALRYSWYPTQGSARIQSLGGASGAIGGEISTLFTNPANLGFYKTGDAVISGGFNSTGNKATYYGQSANDSKVSGFLGTTGVVLGNVTRGDRALKSSAFSIGINRVADFNNRIEFGGTNHKSSMADMFLERINNDGGLATYDTKLAYDVNWVTKDNNGNYFTPADAIVSSTGLLQHGTLKTEGGITEIAVGGAANINDKVYLGGSVGMPVLRYRATRIFNELDPTKDVNQFDAAEFDDYLTTKGMGINLKLGAVFAPVQNFRIGLSAISPTWYTLTDTYDSYAWANTENLPQNGGKNDVESRPNEASVYDYALQTPYRLMGSFTYLFGNLNNISSQKGLVTADIEYVNYMSSRFRTVSNNNGSSDVSYFDGLNTAIGNAYKGAVNARLGAELKFNTFMARVGGAYYGNPYKDLAGEKGNIYQGTAGVGYRNRGFFIDLGYVYTAKTDVYYPYRLENKNNFDPANIKSNGSRVVLTLGVKI